MTSMNRIFKILFLFLQIIITFVVLFVIYMFFALMDNDFGFDGLFGLITIQPMLAVFFSVLTIIICLIIGLPIRLIKNINYWISKHWYISIICIFIGIVLLFCSFLLKQPYYIEDGIIEIPNAILAGTGWFMTAFSILHFFPPVPIFNNMFNFF